MENLASPNVAVANFDELAPTKAGSSDFNALMEKALAEGGAAPPGAEPPAAASTDESSQPLEKRVASTKARRDREPSRPEPRRRPRPETRVARDRPGAAHRDETGRT